MPAYIVVDLTPINIEKLQQYSTLAAETLVPFGGEFLVKGAIEVLHGDLNQKMKVIITFPDRDNAFNWYSSAAYQAIISLRDEAMHSKFDLVG